MAVTLLTFLESRWAKLAAKVILVAFIGLTGIIGSLGYYLDLGRDPSHFRNSPSGQAADEHEQPLQKMYGETLSALTPKQGDANLEWVTRVAPEMNCPIRDEWFRNDAGVYIHNVGVTHVYAVFRPTASKLTALIRSSKVFAKEANILGGDRLNQYARSHQVDVLDMKEGRARAAVIHTGKRLKNVVRDTSIIWVLASLAFGVGFWVKYNGLVIRRQVVTAMALSALATSVPLIGDAAPQLWSFQPAVDWTGSQEPAVGPAITRWLNRHTHTFKDLALTDSNPMVASIVNRASHLQRGDVLLVLSGDLHAEYFADKFERDHCFVRIAPAPKQ